MTAARTILHADMDAFFAAVEALDRPELAGAPVVVGGTGRRGVVAAASYEARAFGVRSAMPTSTARRLCPHATFLAGRMERYAEVSASVMAAFSSVTPLVEPISLDEAFLDVTGSLHGAPPDGLAAALRERVRRDVGLACSIGVAPSKLVAKLASEAAKPRATPAGPRPGRGVVVVAPDDVRSFLHPLPVQAMWGVGPATLERLGRLGVVTVGDLAEVEVPTLVSTLGESAGHHLAALAQGIDERPVVTGRAARSIGHEETFATDRHGVAELRPTVTSQCDAVAARLRRSGLGARTVTLKVRYADFRTITRSVTLGSATDVAVDLRAAALRLLEDLDPTGGVRLLGVSASSLVDGAARQLRLDEAGDPRGTAERVVDEIRARWGDDAIGRGGAAARPRGPWGPVGPAGR